MRSPPAGRRKADLDPVEPALRTYGDTYGFPTLGLGADQAAFGRVRSGLRALPVRNHRRQAFNFAAVHSSFHYASSLDGLFVRRRGGAGLPAHVEGKLGIKNHFADIGLIWVPRDNLG